MRCPLQTKRKFHVIRAAILSSACPTIRVLPMRTHQNELTQFELRSLLCPCRFDAHSLFVQINRLAVVRLPALLTWAGNEVRRTVFH
jgi:hypothetical protein